MKQYPDLSIIQKGHSNNTPMLGNIDVNLESTIKTAPATLNLIYKLCKTLQAEEIVYCHWKSNAALDRSARGENDLDLLVNRADGQQFTEILHRLGFKEAKARPDKQLPGVLDFYGYDDQADRIVHVHAHYQLILGHDAAKNYRLPIEEPFLASAVQQNLFKIPKPEFELIVFVIRMVLKHATWESSLSLEGKLSATEQQELEYLTSRADPSLRQELLEQHLPFMNPFLFNQCLQSFQRDWSTMARYRAGRRLLSELQAHTRRPGIFATCLKFWRRGNWGIRRYVFRRPTRKQLAAGGKIIAFIGGDGSGKSTAVEETYTWLSKRFVTTRVHLGKPTWSSSSFAIKGVLKAARWLGIFSNNKGPALPPANGTLYEFPGYSWLLWHVLTARDRYRVYVKTRRLATNGGIVICDRYPLPQIKSMDGERTGWLLSTEHANRLIKFLVELERKYYQNIVLPDLLIVLRVDPEIAVQRRDDEDPDWVRRRCQEIWKLDWQQTPAYVIDSGRPKADVIAGIKSLIWSEL